MSLPFPSPLVGARTHVLGVGARASDREGQRGPFHRAGSGTGGVRATSAPLSLGSVRLRLATQATLLALLTLAFTHTRSARRAAAAQTGARGLPVVNQWPGRSIGYSLGY